MSVTLKKPFKVLLFYAANEENKTLSYQQGWPHALCSHLGLHCTAINLASSSLANQLRRKVFIQFLSCDAVIILHSVFSNSCAMALSIQDALAKIKRRKIFFIGNEYKLMPEKMTFAQRVGVNLLVTMNPKKKAHELYRECLKCDVVCIPSAGVNLDIFKSLTPRAERPISIGYRAYASPLYLGHNERIEIADRVGSHARSLGLLTDISTNPEDRFTTSEWVQFLNRCQFQIGTEAGGRFFDLEDRTRNAVNQYTAKHPDADLAELEERFFSKVPDPCTGWMISGRHTEAAACETVQILFEGRYNDYFLPDTHYISLKKDFSNIDNVFDRMQDQSYCDQVAKNAYQVVEAELTYDRLIAKLCKAI